MVLTGAVLALVLLLAACSSSGSSKSGGAAATGAADITVKDFSFSTTAVKAGATVTVHNDGPSTHTVTSTDGTSFNVTVDSGKDATFTAPSKAGAYKFHCSIHAQMTSTLTVT